MEKYISIKEFAEEAGVSIQAVYKRVDKNLKQFIKVENGRKVISTEAFGEFRLKESNNQVEFLIKQIEIKDKQLSEKDKQLSEKDIQIAEKDRQIAEKDKQLNSLTDALINEQQSAQQAHALHAGTMVNSPAPKKISFWRRLFG